MAAPFSLAHHLFFNCVRKSTARRSSTKPVFAPFARVEAVTATEGMSIEQAYNEDKSPDKVNLANEVYRNGEGKPHIFQAVRKAEITLACDDFLSRDPLPPWGNPEFIRAATKLILGTAPPAIAQNRVLGVQTRTGIDAMCLAAQFLRQKMNFDTCVLARPSWELYEPIFKSIGFTCHSYQYYNAAKGELNIYGLVADLMTAPEGAVVVLDACAHNPTGIQPSIDEWKLIGHIIKCRKMIPLFMLDMQGLASGDPIKDAWPVRYFVDCGFDLFCAQSFVKNFGLYNEAVSNLMIVLSNPVHVYTVKGQIESMLCESHEESSTAFASRIVEKILTTDSLRKDWLLTLKEMQQRLQRVRTQFANKLIELQLPGPWEQLEEQRGLYLYTNLKSTQIKELRDRHVYVHRSGRINVGALNTKNVDFVATAIKDVILSKNSRSDDFYSDHVQALHHYFNTA